MLIRTVIRRTFILLGVFALTAAAQTTVSAVADRHAPEGRLVQISAAGVEGADHYKLSFKAEGEDSWQPAGEYSAQELNNGAIQAERLIANYTPTQFKWCAFDANGELITAGVSDTVITKAKWFNPNRIGIFIMLLIVSGLIIYYIESAKKAKEIYLRPIAGLNAFEEAVGRATEMGKSVLYVPGIMDLDQVETISGIIILGHVSKMTARYETGLNVPVSRSLVMEASREIVRESYLSEGRPDLFHQDMVHYLTDDQFAFAAGVDGIMLREKPAATFYQGKFYAESLILAETGNSIGAIQIAGTGSPAQLPFFITACDYTLIGEEFFAASAYLGKDPKLIGSIKGQDIAKGVIMVAIVIGVVLETFGFSAFRELFRAL